MNQMKRELGQMLCPHGTERVWGWLCRRWMLPLATRSAVSGLELLSARSSAEAEDMRQIRERVALDALGARLSDEGMAQGVIEKVTSQSFDQDVQQTFYRAYLLRVDPHPRTTPDGNYVWMPGERDTP